MKENFVCSFLATNFYQFKRVEIYSQPNAINQIFSSFPAVKPKLSISISSLVFGRSFRL